MRRIALYCRVSTDNQEKSETIDNQKRDLYKVYNKTDVIKIYEDNPGSGADPDRPGLWELRKDAQKKMFNVIGLWDSSRLARDLKLSLILRDEFKELGIGIEVMGRERDDTDTGKLVSIMEATMDELERNRIKRRFISGRDRRLSEGKLIGCYPPYGYRHVRRDKEKGTDAYLEIYEPEALIVRKTFDLYIKYESILLVAQHLMKEGIRGRGKGRSGPGFMQASMIKKILSRETYIGNQYHGKSSPCIAKFHISKIRKHRFTGRRLNPKSEWKRVQSPRIISDEVFYKAQEIMERRAKHRIEMSKYEFLCQGIIRCSQCGRSYGGRIQHGSYLFYRCPQANTSNLNQLPCKSRTMGVNKLDRAVWAFVSDLISDKGKITKAVIDLKQKRAKDKLSNKKSLENLLSEKNSVKIKRSNLLDLYSDGELSEYAKNDLKIKLAEMDEQEKSLDGQTEEVKSELEEIKNTESLEKEIEETRKIYKKKIKNPSFELKKYIVTKWVEEINIQPDGSVKIRVRIPRGDDKDLKAKEFLYANDKLFVNGVKFEALVRSEDPILN